MPRSCLREPEREIEVIEDVDVVVCGGGPAGVSAAISAARVGASVVLIERYGHIGGLATGGLVILLPHLSDGSSECQIRGIVKEVLDRLDEKSAAVHPSREELGKSEEILLRKWKKYFSVVVDGRVRMSAYFDPEMLKCILNDMLLETNVKIYLHSWIAGVISNERMIEAVIVENKEGRKAIRGKIFIDATGDGDIMHWAGEEYEVYDPTDRSVRSSHVALVFRLGNVDCKKFDLFREQNTEEYNLLLNELEKRIGFRMLPLPSWRDDLVWVNNWMLGIDPLRVSDLTKAEIELRRAMLVAYEFFKQRIPGFEYCYIVDTAPQLGVRGSRRLRGQYVLTKEDVEARLVPPDVVAVFPPITHNASEEHPNVYFPLRCLLPRKTKNLIVAGRCFHPMHLLMTCLI